MSGDFGHRGDGESLGIDAIESRGDEQVAFLDVGIVRNILQSAGDDLASAVPLPCSSEP
jgi:hypothetical protein